jgi:hypothetical protein
MSYKTINRCANDQSFIGRLTAASAQEGAYEPSYAANLLRWPVSSASDIEAAYASAIAGENPDPGGDESVITDGMILGQVQANWEESWETAPVFGTPPA